MTIKQAYLEFLRLVNQNATNNRTSVDKPRFIMLYKDMETSFLRHVLEKRNEDDIRDIQKLLEKDVPMVLDSATSTSVSSFVLPTNYFDFANIRALAKNHCCPEREILVHEVKSEDVEELRVDTNNEPSFEYEESFCHTASGNMLLYKKGFEYTKVYLTYYRYPVVVDIEGYKKEDSSISVDVDPEYDDKVVRKILQYMAKDFTAINSDPNGYQLNKDRLFTI